MAKLGPIVIIEDDEDDVELFQEIFKEINPGNQILYFEKADDALHFLRTTNEIPFIIISDVNLPAVSGLDLKKQIDCDEYLRKISVPFIFLSTSSNIVSVRKAYAELVIQGYFEKPLLMKDLQEMLQAIIGYWKTSVLPY